jgi:hypothetical protein
MTDSLFHVFNVIAWVIVVYLQISTMRQCIVVLGITYKTAEVVLKLVEKLESDNKDGAR